MPDFLDLEPRSRKPRDGGLTHVLDSGLTVGQVDGLFEMAGDYIDIVKLGWGTGYVTQNLEAKLARYRELGVPVVIGGTLGEVALARDRFREFRDWLAELGLTYFEISDGTIEMDHEEKLRSIADLAEDFTVLSEVGKKDPDALVAPYRWVKQIKEELEAGAWKVILEARESGTAGVYRPNGEVRMGLIEEIQEEVDPNRLIFEAPRIHQQIWFITRFGRDVNLGNIHPEHVIGLETLRLGLRSDTVGPILLGEPEEAPMRGEGPGN